MTLVFIACSLLSLVIIHRQRVIKIPHDGRNVTVVCCVDDPLWMGGTSVQGMFLFMTYVYIPIIHMYLYIPDCLTCSLVNDCSE